MENHQYMFGSLLIKSALNFQLREELRQKSGMKIREEQ